jgi:hypothetical protein
MMLLATFLSFAGGCASIRVTDPEHTADELYLMNVATASAVSKISTDVLRDRKVYIETTYLTAATQPSDQQQYLLGELRSRLLLGGVRLVSRQKDAEIVMEVRSQGISNNHIEFLLGLPSTSLVGVLNTGIATTTPELALLKKTTQMGYASIAYIAYWNDTGEVVASSGPFVGYTKREDWWFVGLGPSTYGNIPPAQPAPIEINSSKSTPAPTTGGNTAKPPPAPPPPAHENKGAA